MSNAAHKVSRLILCADDYALAPGVSRAICDLLDAGRLSATSCMVTSAHWPEHAAWLRPHLDQADIGLHLTLTDQQPLGSMPRLAPRGRFPSAARLFALAITGCLPLGEIADEISRQFEAFMDAMGRPPIHLDGHQFIHRFPGIREAAITAFADCLQSASGYVRVPGFNGAAVLERRLALGRCAWYGVFSPGLRQLARLRGLDVNDGFAGIYDLSDREPYEKLFERFLIDLEGRTILLCHPGWVDHQLLAVDPLTRQRENEARYFASEEFPASLDRHGIRLGRFY
jgi:predicted glycoside hydrolase/deacetylase ChbG (UPF0249 family)